MKKYPQSFQSGFTLPELLIVCLIMVVMTTVALGNYRIYTSDAALSNTAHDLALTIRQTQLYGVVGRGALPGGGKFGFGYGLHFMSSNPTAFIIYEDSAADPNDPDSLPNEQYDLREFLSLNSLPEEFQISRLCKVIAGVETCIQTNNSADSFLDIQFVRPNPEMTMTTNVGITDGSIPVPYDPESSQGSSYGARIYISSGTKERSIYIDKTGQITID